MAMLVDIVRDSVAELDDDSGDSESVAEQTQEPETPSIDNQCCSNCQTIKPIAPTIVPFMRTNEAHVDTALQEGHFELKCGHRIPILNAACKIAESNMPIAVGFVANRKAKVLRDTGCNGVIVRLDLVPKGALTGERIPCILADKTVRYVPVASIYINSPYYIGTVSAACMKNPTCDVLIGNIEGARLPWQPDPTRCCPVETPIHAEISAAVETRNQTKEKVKPFKTLKVKQPMSGIVTPEILKHEQQNDQSLTKIRERVEQTILRKNGSSFTFIAKNGLIFREYQKVNTDQGNAIRQIIVPAKFRKTVMSLAHEAILGSHLGTQKTTDRILSNFFWPTLQTDVKRFCQSCNICQRTIPKGRVTRVPLGITPIIDVPFKRVTADIVGPIIPCSERGQRYILVVVDYATRYPEAVPMKSIESERVAEELLNIFSRLGFPSEILTDQGTQFTANVMKEISRLLSIKQLTTTPYKP